MKADDEDTRDAIVVEVAPRRSRCATGMTQPIPRESMGDLVASARTTQPIPAGLLAQLVRETREDVDWLDPIRVDVEDAAIVAVNAMPRAAMWLEPVDEWETATDEYPRLMVEDAVEELRRPRAPVRSIGRDDIAAAVAAYLAEVES